MPEPIADLTLVGPGRAASALGTALLEAGAVGHLRFVGRPSDPRPDIPLLTGNPASAGYAAGVAALANLPTSGILLCVPDATLSSLAAELASVGISTHIPVLHLSGALGSAPLAALAEQGHPTGSFHPLVALADVEAAARLRGAWYAIEGDPGAEELAKLLVAHLDGRVLSVASDGKPLYHAAAVAASNFVVALLSVAERWMESAGVPPGDAHSAVTALAAGAVQNVARAGAAEGLTGPVARGDVATVRAHLARLSGSDRLLYSVLAESALVLARQRGLPAGAADELARVLRASQ